jgi:hypothetical protein
MLYLPHPFVVFVISLLFNLDNVVVRVSELNSGR